MPIVGILRIPSPSILQSVVECPIQHTSYVLTNDRQELPSVKRSARCNIEIFTVWMRADQKVVRRRARIPGRVRLAHIAGQVNDGSKKV